MAKPPRREHSRPGRPRHPRQGSRRQPIAVQPDDKLVRVAGLPSVLELLKREPDRVERLYFAAEHRDDAQPFCAALARRHKVYRQLNADEMKRVAGTAMHGGIVALAHPRPIRPVEADEAAAWAMAGVPLLIMDGVGNPQNIGAIARTAAFFGVERLVLSDHPAQAGLSDTSYRIAKGGLERLEIRRAAGLPAWLRKLAGSYRVIGTATTRGKPLDRIETGAKPVALVLGNEEHGLDAATLACCEDVVSIRGSGRVQSLNVAASAAILIHALLSGSGRQR